ncbi:MAG: hypothetical protein E6Q44_07855 [Flavobacteriales bacterium]|nr:MAG: hypothetical protein E6Q44_07855 [Flavobacteriales bacterium]
MSSDAHAWSNIIKAKLFSRRTLEQRILKSHPLREFRVPMDAILARKDVELDALCAPMGRLYSSRTPLRASLI